MFTRPPIYSASIGTYGGAEVRIYYTRLSISNSIAPYCLRYFQVAVASEFSFIDHNNAETNARNTTAPAAHSTPGPFVARPSAWTQALMRTSGNG